MTSYLRRVFAAAGLRLIATPMGCCGMAGAYGHEARHVEMSRRIFDLDWGRRIERSITAPSACDSSAAG